MYLPRQSLLEVLLRSMKIVVYIRLTKTWQTHNRSQSILWRRTRVFRSCFLLGSTLSMNVIFDRKSFLYPLLSYSVQRIFLQVQRKQTKRFSRMKNPWLWTWLSNLCWAAGHWVELILFRYQFSTFEIIFSISDFKSSYFDLILSSSIIKVDRRWL